MRKKDETFEYIYDINPNQTSIKPRMNFKELSKQSNDRIQAIANKINTDTFTEKERNELASLIEPKLKWFIWKFLRNDEETSHALMDCLEKIFKSLNTYSTKYRFTTWAYTIARNQALYHQDQVKRKVKPMLSMDVLPPQLFEKPDNYAELYERENLKVLLYEATLKEIENLPDSIEKTLLIEKDLNRLRGEDLAIKYEMNINTVKTKLRKARTIIRNKVIKKHPDLKERLSELV